MPIFADDGETIYTWNGHAVAYTDGENLYSWNGHHIGWYVHEVIYDLHGRRAGLRQANVRWRRTLPRLNTLSTPDTQKYARHAAYARPALSTGYSDTPLLQFLKPE